MKSRPTEMAAVVSFSGIGVLIFQFHEVFMH